MKKKIIVSLVSFVILCGINYFLFPLADKLNESFGVNVLGINSFLNIILYYVLWKTVNNAPKIVGRANIFAISIAALLAISQSVGNLLIKRNSLLIWNWEYLGFSLMLIGLFFIFYYALSYVLNWMDNYKAKEKEEEKWWFFTDNARSFWLVAIALFICYLPFFISIWPGLKGWDFNNGPHSLMYQVTTGEYNAWHPIAYTLFFELFYKIGKVLDFNFLPLFEITQILLCCLTFSYLIYFLAKIRIPKWQRIIIFFFLALNPFLHMFAPAPTKDVLFMIACISLFIEMYKMAGDGDYFSKKRSVFKIIPVLFLFTVSRNNAWYSFLITIPFLLFVLRAHWIKLSMIFLTVIILFQGFNFYQFQVLGAIKANNSEAISPILQQMRKVYLEHEDKLTEEEITILGEIFDLEYKKFIDTSNDHSKYVGMFQQNHFNENLAKYLGFWAKLGLKYPLVYAEAFLNTNLSLWYLDAPTPRFNWSAQGYLMIEPSDIDNVWSLSGDISKLELPALTKIYLHINRNIVASNIPIISFLTSYAFSILAMILVMLLLLYRKSKVYVILIPFAAYIFTCLFAPVAYARYLMPIIVLALPSIAILLTHIRRGEK